MCAIAGIISQEPRPENASEIRQMIKTMRHRGPDGFGVWASPGMTCALGHARLSILDVTNSGAQPMRTSDGRYHVVFNGEIYNFIELRSELECFGHTFSGGSDTEVLLAAYVQWGRDCLNRFNGMFAFAIWDEQERSLFMARSIWHQAPSLLSMERKALLCLGTKGVPSYSRISCRNGCRE